MRVHCKEKAYTPIHSLAVILLVLPQYLINTLFVLSLKTAGNQIGFTRRELSLLANRKENIPLFTRTDKTFETRSYLRIAMLTLLPLLQTHQCFSVRANTVPSQIHQTTASRARSRQTRPFTLRASYGLSMTEILNFKLAMKMASTLQALRQVFYFHFEKVRLSGNIRVINGKAGSVTSHVINMDTSLQPEPLML